MKGRREGWSLVETTVGMVVGTLTLMALGGAMISNSYLHSLALSRMELTSVGETQLDQLREHAALQTADPFRLSAGGSLTSNVPNHFQVITTARNRQYTVRWQVTSGLAGTRDVTVRVLPVSPRRNEVPFIDVRTLMIIR